MPSICRWLRVGFLAFAVLAGPANAQPVAAADPAALSPEEVADKMIAAIRSSPCIRLTVDIVSDAAEVGTVQVQAWMTVDKARMEVFRQGRIIYARYKGEGRVQEYVPQGEFKFGSPAPHVVLEYDTGPEDDEWPRLVGHGLGCEAVGAAGDSWLREPDEENPTIPQAIAMNIVGSSMTLGELHDRPCYVFRSLRRTSATQSSVMEIYVDRESFEPLQQTLTTMNGSKVLTRRADQRIEHLPDDRGLSWRLDARELRQRDAVPAAVSRHPDDKEGPSGVVPPPAMPRSSASSPGSGANQQPGVPAVP
jgi:hypothetical protein